MITPVQLVGGYIQAKDFNPTLITICIAVTFKIHKGVGERWTNFLLGIAGFSFALSISVHRGYTRNAKGFRALSFLFSLDAKKMWSVYRLNKRRAGDQLRAQSTFAKLAWIWYGFYTLTIGLDILKFAMEDPNSYGTVTLLARTVWYLLLFLSQQASVLRSFLVLGQLELSLCTCITG